MKNENILSLKPTEDKYVSELREKLQEIIANAQDAAGKKKKLKILTKELRNSLPQTYTRLISAMGNFKTLYEIALLVYTLLVYSAQEDSEFVSEDMASCVLMKCTLDKKMLEAMDELSEMTSDIVNEEFIENIEKRIK